MITEISGQQLSDLRFELRHLDNDLNSLFQHINNNHVIETVGSSDLFRAYDINDDRELSDSEREERLTKIFTKHGIEVEFVNTRS